jgi:hypothetical protein
MHCPVTAAVAAAAAAAVAAAVLQTMASTTTLRLGAATGGQQCSSWACLPYAQGEGCSAGKGGMGVLVGWEGGLLLARRGAG